MTPRQRPYSLDQIASAKRRVHISVQLDKDLLKQISHRAIDLNLTRTELINRAIAMFLNGCEREYRSKP